MPTCCAAKAHTVSPKPAPPPFAPGFLPCRSITGLQSGLYSLVTPTLALAGASYLFMPSATLGAVFGWVGCDGRG